ncbi:malonyl-CoA decarboxylase [Oceanicella sp. SM1341]|uniref:malonyl-CoA decarboxylase n=1 Tax=Oceanicella sp. SM1341 TaxID=1548889 RepID=UPI0018E52B1C|nr:malonyl-CoA decarboxylase [Oceanicella sp. SM1341]
MRATTIVSDLVSRVSDLGLALMPQSGGRATLIDRCDVLVSGKGEATSLALARDILDRYAALEPQARGGFFLALAQRFGVDEDRMLEAAQAWTDDPSDTTARALHAASEPRAQELIRRLNRAPGGTQALVAMRADLLKILRDHPETAALDSDFRHLFSSWFNRGFLTLRHIDWHTPAVVLEKIIAYEAVHEIQGWDDLRRRVGAPDRRLYAFFHPALPDEPLIFVEVALTAEIPRAIGPILEGANPMAGKEARTAVFYSISNCQPGLRGISFGNFLIKTVVEELRAEFRRLETFVTLSPVPGLRRWAGSEAAQKLLTAEERAALEAETPPAPELLSRITAKYLVQGRSPRGGPADPVARFHLGNGARLEQVNPEGDASPGGMEASWGAMVNYLYDLDRIERNHEAFANEGTVAFSPAIQKLIKSK